MKLSFLTQDLMPIPRDVDIVEIWDDSRRVTKGSLCAIFSSLEQGGERFAQQACSLSASVILALPEVVQCLRPLYPEVIFLSSPQPRKVFRVFVQRFFGRLSDDVRVIGVTGTNGKTTITYFLESIWQQANLQTAVIGTINRRIGNQISLTKNTTPGLLDNYLFLSELKQKKVPYALMEVSSHALDQGRVEGIDFRSAIFTNLTGDHLDYHQTMQKYFDAKKLLFQQISSSGCGIINQDDEWGRKLKDSLHQKTIHYGMDSASDIFVEMKSYSSEGMIFDVNFPQGAVTIQTPFVGKHNVYNILAAFATALAEGISSEIIKKGIENLAHVPGRLERVETHRGFSVFIDYAHTDDGLRNVLLSLQQIPHRKIILVFGAGGDRDKSKRPRMAKVASSLADEVILTSDNPRTENPLSILQDIAQGMTKTDYHMIEDRREAMAFSLKMAQEGDIVLLAGKGHETYQILQDRTIDFVERDILKELLG